MSEVDEAMIELDRLLADCHRSLDGWIRKIGEAKGPPLPEKMGSDIELALQDAMGSLFTARDVVDGYISWTGD